MARDDWRMQHLTLGLLTGVAVSYFIFLYLSLEVAIVLIIFNFLYISLIFPLNAALERKLLLLLTGNMIGVAWNSLFSILVQVALSYVGESADTLSLIFNPLINLIWIVSFWSVSLTVLVKTGTERLN